MVFVVVVAIALGNGPAVPVVFLLVGLIYVVFSAAFTAMSPFVASASGFYSGSIPVASSLRGREAPPASASSPC